MQLHHQFFIACLAERDLPRRFSSDVSPLAAERAFVTQVFPAMVGESFGVERVRAIRSKSNAECDQIPLLRLALADRVDQPVVMPRSVGQIVAKQD